MTITIERVFENFDTSFDEFKEATPLTAQAKAQKLASQIDLLGKSQKGLEHLYDKCLEMEAAGIFKDTPWEDAQKQAPSLVKWTILSGHPNSSYEIISQLRFLAYANGRSGISNISSADAAAFLEEVIVHNMEFAFDELTEESRTKLTQPERRKVVHLFKYLVEHARLGGVKEKILIEIKMVLAQRPIVTDAVRNLIQTVYQKMELDERIDVDSQLQYYVNAVYFPGPMVDAHPGYGSYKEALGRADEKTLLKEIDTMANYLHETGLTNPYLAMMLRHLAENQSELIPRLLQLNPLGTSEWEKYRDFTLDLILNIFSEDNYRGIYGLKRMLQKNLFSRSAVRAGVTNLKLLSINPQIEKRILKTVSHPLGEINSKQVLIASVISLLGQPLGIGQGNNATCQSARGISMWAQHSPAKLINMVTTVATSNNLIMRFENQDLESIKLAKGLVDELDLRLDAVSVILVPHLDKIYNEMMMRASGRAEDPHKWANPALYGQWIPSGFASAYSYLTNSIHDFKGFARIFYASFHPKFNGGKQIVYPNPIGIFVTTSRGDMLGFHAVSLLRADYNPNKPGELRAYFLNPNNEGRQDWGQEIKPTVYGNGEKYGESSLPFYQLLARTYAFHFDTLEVREHTAEIPDEEIEKVYKLALESWGKSYQWNDFKKQWYDILPG